MRRFPLAALIALSMAAATAVPVAAEASFYPFSFHDCVGPAGTPTSFTAEKIKLPASNSAGPPYSQTDGYLLTDGTGVFIALIRVGVREPPGVYDAGVATTTCLVETPIGTRTFIGFLTPAP